jgi:MFS family permease
MTPKLTQEDDVTHHCVEMCLSSLLLATLYSQTLFHMNAEPRISITGLILVFLTPALGGFLFGYDIGATSFVLGMLRDGCHDSSDMCWWSDFSQSSIQQGFMVAAVSLGALVGSHIVLMYLVKKIGRRAEIRACAVLYLFGTTLNVLSGTMLCNSSEMVGFMCLITGRLVYGVGVGFIMHGVSVECAWLLFVVSRVRHSLTRIRTRY